MNRRQIFGLAAAATFVVGTSAKAGPKPAGVRYSVDESDPGYAAYKKLRGNGFDLRVYLNGTLIKGGVTTVDTGEGLIMRLARDPDGKSVLNDARDGLKIETLRGDVRVEAYPWRKA